MPDHHICEWLSSSVIIGIQVQRHQKRQAGYQTNIKSYNLQFWQIETKTFSFFKVSSSILSYVTSTSSNMQKKAVNANPIFFLAFAVFFYIQFCFLQFVNLFDTLPSTSSCWWHENSYLRCTCNLVKVFSSISTGIFTYCTVPPTGIG